MTKDLIYKATKPYSDDINDLIEDEIEKGRGPDLKPRKVRLSRHDADTSKEDHAKHAEHYKKLGAGFEKQHNYHAYHAQDNSKPKADKVNKSDNELSPSLYTESNN